MFSLLVFTGGGIAPALNATLYGVITAAQHRGWRVFGGMEGWACLLPKGKIVELTHRNIAPIRFQGGSFLRSSRTNPLKDAATTRAVLSTIRRKGFDALLPIGGDDTLGAAERLFRKFQLPVVGIPKTIDNDLGFTYFTPGFPTAAYTLGRYTDALRQAAYGARRIFVIEVMGGKAGWLAAAAALGGADIIIPPERPIPVDRVLTRIRNAYKHNGSYAVVVVSHQARVGRLKSEYATRHDAYGIRRAHLISVPLRDVIEKKLGVETLLALPGNTLSASDPIALDQRCAQLLGRRAILAIAQRRFGSMIAITKNLRPTIIPLERAVEKSSYHNLGRDDFDFTKLAVRRKLLRYFSRLTGLRPVKQRPYTKFLATFAKEKR